MSKNGPQNPGIVKIKTEKKTGAGSAFWIATCKNDGHAETGVTEAEAVRNLASHLVNHPGSVVKRV